MTTQTRIEERPVPSTRAVSLGALARAYALPLAITVLVLAGALVGPAALSTAMSGEAAVGARLEVGWGYVLMAPVANLLDTLSVLTLAQHYAVLATLVLAYVAWRIFRTRRTAAGPLRRAGREAVAATAALFGLVAFYGYGMIGPRPMAAIEPADPEVVVVDVHSHTHASHDGRAGFDAAANREWHASAGFDAVYVSDHRTWDGWLAGESANPARAGDGTVLLPALEVKYAGKYASALGEPWRYRAAMDGNDLVADTLYRLFRERGVRPTLVLTIPSRLSGVVASTPGTLGYVAVEMSDASPRGLQQSRRDRALLRRMVDSLDLAPVAASNNHGWGRTAAAWTLMRIPGWRAMSPAELSTAIEAKLHAERRDASWVVERRVPWYGDEPLALAATGPAITWGMFGGIGWAERVSWLFWTWTLAFLLIARRSAAPAAPPAARRRTAAGVPG